MIFDNDDGLLGADSIFFSETFLVSVDCGIGARYGDVQAALVS